MNDKIHNLFDKHVTVPNISKIFGVFVFIVWIYFQTQTHINDDSLHSFNEEWRAKITSIEKDLEDNKFSEEWRTKIRELETGLKAVSGRSDKRHARTKEDTEKINKLLRSFLEIKVNVNSNKIK